MADRFVARPSGTPVLEIRGLNVFYGRSHALQGVDLTLRQGALSVVGRNGMGKTTLCNAIMGLVRASSGSIRFAGEELVGRAPADIARLGIGYVPQGRRLWRSLTVDEHLRLVAGERRGAWTIERIYDTFPRLAERKSNAGSQLSGGEQQMVAISRALLLNPRLLVMDEPTEGLAPVIVAQVDDILVRLAEDGEIAVLVIEQKIGVATEVAETVAIMVNGRINRLIDSRELAADRDLQERLLGVGRHGHEDIPETGRPRRATGSARTDERGRRPAPPASTCRTRSCRRAGRSRCRPPRSRRRPAPPRPPCAGARRAAAARRRLAVDGRQRSLCRRRRHARHQGRRAAPDPRYPEGSRPAHAPGRSLHQRQTFGRRRAADRGRAQPPARRRRPLHRRPRHIGGCHGAGVRGLDQAPDRRRRHHLGRRLGRHGHGGARHARPADRRAQGADLHRGIGQRAGLRRPLRHHDDVLGHRRAGAQLHLAPGARQRRAGHGGHGQAAPRRSARRGPAPGGGRPARRRPHHVRRHHHLRAAGHRPAQGRVRLPRVPRHRHRRPVHGEAGRLAAAVGRHRRHHHRNLRHDDGRRVPRHRGPLRRHHPRAAALRRLGRRARHGELRRARDGP